MIKGQSTNHDITIMVLTDMKTVLKERFVQ